MLHVALGARRFRVERPWGDLPPGPGVVSDVAVHPGGQVLVLKRRDPLVDPPAPAVIVLAPDGTRLGAWGADIADGHMLGCGADGRIYVVDRDMHEIIVFTLDGTRLGGVGTRGVPGAPFSHPTDVAVAPDGDLLVSDGYGASRVHRFRDGAPHSSWGTPGGAAGQFTTPHAVWVLDDGRVVVADRENNRLQVFSPDGAFLAAWDDHYKPMDIATDPGGNLLVTDQIPRLSLLSPDGALLGRCRPVLNGAHGVACQADGTILLAEINPSRITRLVPAT